MRLVYLFVFFLIQILAFGQVSIGIPKTDSILNLQLADSSWSYNTTNNPDFYKKEINDSTWQKSKTSLYENDFKTLNFKGFAWFRKRIFIDSTYKNTPIVLKISQKGASEVYLNGALVGKIGKIGKTIDDEEEDNGDNSPIYINPVYGEYNVISVKYSNLWYTKSYGNDGIINAGFNVKIQSSTSFYYKSYFSTVLVASLCIGLFVFFISIGLIHFLLFIFYRERRSNLYFMLFCFLFGWYFLHAFLSETIITNVGQRQVLNLISVISVPLFILLLLTNLYSLFYPKFPKQFWIFLVASIAISIISLLFTELFTICSITLALIILIEVFRVLFVALKNKSRGSKIIGSGFGLFCLFILTIAILGMVMSNINLGNNIITFSLFILSMISIPLSMSIFLAWDFSQTNKNLKLQLVKNDELSAQTIAQEKEKQELLANQNKLLEEQVEERTREINEQKRELHLKNVEITDSINYSKHIQMALLPEQEDIKLALPGSFIFYQPKDIVSGDFYWFYKIDKSSFNHRQSIINNYQSPILIAAADCTGHGVPGALMSLIAIENLNKAIEFEQEPSKILELVNKNIKNALKQNTDKAAKDGMDIALCKIEQLSETNFKVLFSAANRPLWIVRENAKEVEEIKATKTAIGGHTDYHQIFEQHVLEFKKGDSFYMFSDGYADQFGSDKNKKLTTKRFKEILLEINSLPPEEQKQYLQNYIYNWKGKLEQIDDILVIGLKF